MTPLMLSDALAEEKMEKKKIIFKFPQTFLEVVFWNTRELLKLRKLFLLNLVSNNSHKPIFLTLHLILFLILLLHSDALLSLKTLSRCPSPF